MSPLQLAQQIKKELQLVEWKDLPGEDPASVVFGAYGVVVFAGTPNEEQIPPGFPWCMVGLGTGTLDADDPQYISQSFSILVGVEVAGDPLGEFAIIGGSTSDLLASGNRGVAEVDNRVRFAVQHLTGADGASLQLGATSMAAPTPIAGRHVAISELTLTGYCTSTQYYAPPQQVRVSGSAWTWQGAHCSDRFDFLQYRMLEKVGATPSSDPTNGTVVYTGATAGATYATTSGYTYTVFADYDARGTGAVEGSSEPIVGSYVVVA